MTTKISTWGNSYGIRVPKGLLKDAGLKDGMEVSLELLTGGKIVVEALEKFPSLKELLKSADPKNAHPEFWIGEPQGKEIW